LNQHDFRQLVSGRSTGFKSQAIRFALRVTAQGYKAIVILRNFLYSKEWLRTYRVNAIVISVGNITTGGTGKTPFVIWLYKFLQQNRIQCAILTRGYKTRRASCVMRRAKNERDTQHTMRSTIDEPAILAETCPQANVIVNPDRVAGANEAVNKFDAKILIMDDGFQHRRLARDLDIITIDATQPFGYGKLLPAGLLREPADSLKRADAIVITRSDQVADEELADLERKLLSINNNMTTARATHSPVCAKTIDNKVISIEELKDKKILAFCGIGNPDAFLNTIKNLGANPVGAKIYDDHYHYTDKDVADIRKEAMHLKTDLILTTQKDWSKISEQVSISDFQSPIPFVYLAVELKITSGEDRITSLIKDCLTGKIHPLGR
jgi:tetraacyldisaccharide 4'-kinase